MNNTPDTDLERRLAARLQPTRVPGAERAWAQVAPRLGRPGTARPRRTLATVAATLVLVAALTAAANVLIFPRGGSQYGGSPIPPTPTIQAPVAVAPNMSIHGDRVLSLAPLPPFTIFQLTAPPEGLHLLTQAYDPGTQVGRQRLPAMGATSVSASSQPDDSATRQTAEQWSNDLFIVGQEATLVLVYAATPDDLIGLLQRAAADKLLPTGEAVTVRGLPGVRTQHDGRTTITWIERGTYLELTANARANELPALAATLIETAVNAPQPTFPGGTLPLPDPAADPTTSGQGIVVTASLDRDEIVRRCGNWDPTLHATNQDQVTCYAKAMTGASDKEGYGLSRITWSEAATSLGIAPPSISPDDRPVWQVTFVTNTNNIVVTTANVILDAATGEPLTIVGSATTP